MNFVMPWVALIELPKPDWLPPLPIPLFLLWPMVWACLGIARLLERDRPTTAAQLRLSMQAFRDLRGLTIDVDSADQSKIHVRFL